MTHAIQLISILEMNKTYTNPHIDLIIPNTVHTAYKRPNWNWSMGAGLQHMVHDMFAYLRDLPDQHSPALYVDTPMVEPTVATNASTNNASTATSDVAFRGTDTTYFEYLSTHNKIAVVETNPVRGDILLQLLQVIIDRNPYILQNPYIIDDSDIEKHALNMPEIINRLLTNNYRIFEQTKKPDLFVRRSSGRMKRIHTKQCQLYDLDAIEYKLMRQIKRWTRNKYAVGFNYFGKRHYTLVSHDGENLILSTKLLTATPMDLNITAIHSSKLIQSLQMKNNCLYRRLIIPQGLTGLVHPIPNTLTPDIVNDYPEMFISDGERRAFLHTLHNL